MESVNEIEGDIDRTRVRLGGYLRELETRVDAATDWRKHVRARPYLALGVACAGGFLLGQLARSARRRHTSATRSVPSAQSDSQAMAVARRAQDLWEDIANTLIALGARKLTAYIGGLVPGFTDEYTHLEARRGEPSPRST
jgi:hypothetical protein